MSGGNFSGGGFYGGTSGASLPINLTTDVTGVLPIANGGTNSSTALNNGRVMVSSGGGIVEGASMFSDGASLQVGAGTHENAAFGLIGNASYTYLANWKDEDENTVNSITGTINGGDLIWELGDIDSIDTDAVIGFDTASSLGYVSNGGETFGCFLIGTKTRTNIDNVLEYQGERNTGDVLSGQVRLSDVSTTDATITTLSAVAIPTDSVVLLEYHITARRTGGASGSAGDSATYVRTLRAKNISGTVTIHDVQTDYTSEDQAAWNVAFSVSTTNVRLSVTGAAANNINWHSEVKIQTNV